MEIRSIVRNNKRDDTQFKKVYVIDPKQFQQGAEVDLQRGRLFSQPEHKPQTKLYPGVWSLPTQRSKPSSIPRPSPKEHQNRDENYQDKDEEDAMMSFLTNQSRTRSGRLTKPRLNNKMDTSNINTSGTEFAQPAQPRRRRETSEFFRCQTCRKYYIGKAKLKLHLQKFPAHEASLEYQATIAAKRRTLHASVAVQSDAIQAHSAAAGPDRSVTKADAAAQVQEPEFAVPQKLELRSVAETEVGFLPTTVNSIIDESNGRRIPNPIEPYMEVHCEGLNSSPTPSPSPSSNSLPFWNSFSSFNNAGREESSPDDRPPVSLLSSTSSRKEESVEMNTGIKTVWDLVEKKLTQNGINLIMMELSDVAEKLGKIARDKIIPIREDEEDRLPTSTPIVRVENPFMSHLLDLPFGAYVFREDGGIRRPPLPPPSTDLSLTAGEVDIDKFLACNMEMDLSLPHLTSLDIASVCNN